MNWQVRVEHLAYRIEKWMVKHEREAILWILAIICVVGIGYTWYW